MKLTWDQFGASSKAESRLIGCFMVDASIFHALGRELDESKFVHKENQIIFRHLQSIYETGDQVDLALLIQSIRDSAESDTMLMEWILDCFHSNTIVNRDIAEYWHSKTLHSNNT